jgi:methionine biosynthesis protein MetW
MSHEELDARQKEVLKLFSGLKAHRILDVGCGNGLFSLLLKQVCNAEVYGVEISKINIESATKKGINALQLDLDKEIFPFEDNYFDAVFAGEVIEHLYDPDHLLDEIYRTLKPKGALILTTPNLACWQNRISLLFGYQPYATTISLRYRLGHISGDSDLLPEKIVQDRRHISLFTLRALRKLLEIHKFDVVIVKGVEISFPDYMKFPSNLSRLVKIIDRLLSFYPPFCPQIIILCKK